MRRDKSQTDYFDKGNSENFKPTLYAEAIEGQKGSFANTWLNTELKQSTQAFPWAN